MPSTPRFKLSIFVLTAALLSITSFLQAESLKVIRLANNPIIRPEMLTAFAVVVGGIVILTDPIFQGLAISLLFGAIASLVISPIAVPLIYFMAHKPKINSK